MAQNRLPNIKRLAKEDFKSEDQELVGKLSYPINSFFEEVRNLLNGNLDFGNFNQEIIVISVRVNNVGIPLTQTQFKSTLRTNIQGMTCISAENLDFPNTYPTSGIFVTFSQEAKLVNLNHITGLQDSQQYKLKFITYGT